jgi:hypothetical protein
MWFRRRQHPPDPPQRVWHTGTPSGSEVRRRLRLLRVTIADRGGDAVTYALASAWLTANGTPVNEATWDAFHAGDQAAVDMHRPELAAIADYYEISPAYLVGPDDDTTDLVDAALEHEYVKRRDGLSFVQACTKGEVTADWLRAVTAAVAKTVEREEGPRRPEQQPSA